MAGKTGIDYTCSVVKDFVSVFSIPLTGTLCLFAKTLVKKLFHYVGGWKNGPTGSTVSWVCGIFTSYLFIAAATFWFREMTTKGTYWHLQAKMWCCQFILMHLQFADRREEYQEALNYEMVKHNETTYRFLWQHPVVTGIHIFLTLYGCPVTPLIFVRGVLAHGDMISICKLGMTFLLLIPVIHETLQAHWYTVHEKPHIGGVEIVTFFYVWGNTITRVLTHFGLVREFESMNISLFLWVLLFAYTYQNVFDSIPGNSKISANGKLAVYICFSVCLFRCAVITSRSSGQI